MTRLRPHASHLHSPPLAQVHHQNSGQSRNPQGNQREPEGTALICYFTFLTFFKFIEQLHAHNRMEIECKQQKKILHKGKKFGVCCVSQHISTSHVALLSPVMSWVAQILFSQFVMTLVTFL